MPEPTVTPALDPLAIELLADLPPEVRRLVVEAFDRVDFEFGAVLMREGDPADPYWVLTDGRVRVVRDGADGTEVTLATLGPGATFGEGALTREGARTSTVRAASPGTALRLDASVVRACGVAALAMVCRYHGKRVPLSRLRTLVGTTVDGTSAAGILRAARTVGFVAKVVQSSKSELESLAVALAAQLIASVALLFYYSTLMGIVFFVSVPVYLLITRWSLARLVPATASLEEEAVRYASRQVEIVKGIETAKALAAEGLLQQALVEHQVALNARQIGVDRPRAVYGALTQGLGFALLAGFLAIGITEKVGNTLSIGGLVACVTLVALATPPMQELLDRR